MDNLRALIHDYGRLFWYVPQDRKPFLSEPAVVETILNYGDMQAIKRLFNILGKEKVADIFYRQTHGKYLHRNNYQKLTAHFFDIYFHRHVPSYSLSESK